jgi:hypothetical protein
MERENTGGEKNYISALADLSFLIYFLFQLQDNGMNQKNIFEIFFRFGRISKFLW